jgi:hypothetical protein
MPGCRVAMYGGLETRLLHICWDFGWSWGYALNNRVVSSKKIELRASS